MKQHIFTRGGFLLAVMSMFLSFFACRQDLQQEPIETFNATMSAEIKAAKAWFDANKQMSTTFKDVEPLWSKAQNFDGTVEVPYTVNGKTPLPKTSGQVNKFGRQRLVLLDKTDHYDPFIVNYVPSDAFQGNIKTVNIRNLKAEQFDGVASYQKWNETTSHKLYYKNGEVIRRTTAKIISQDTPVPETCVQSETCIVWFVCVTYQDETTCRYSDTTCKTTSECDDTGDKGSGTGNGGDGGGGGCNDPFCGGGGGGGSGGCSRCGGAGDTWCARNPNAPECGCEERTGLFATATVGTYQHLLELIEFVGRLSGVSLKAGGGTVAPLQYKYRPQIGSSYDFSEGSIIGLSIFDANNCSRTIETTHWGQCTHTILIGPVETATSFPWGQFNHTWTF